LGIAVGETVELHEVEKFLDLARISCFGRFRILRPKATFCPTVM